MKKSQLWDDLPVRVILDAQSDDSQPRKKKEKKKKTNVSFEENMGGARDEDCSQVKKKMRENVKEKNTTRSQRVEK